MTVINSKVSVSLLRLILIALPLFIGIGCQSPQKTWGKKQGFTAQHHLVVTGHPEASKIGDEILQNGGNAIDAMVAVHFALAVCLPSAGNIGGGGFMVYRSHSGETTTLDFREKAPGAARKDMFLDSLGQYIPDLSIFGRLAVGVPGSVDGIIEAHKWYGTLPLEQLISPAIRLALQGFPITEKQAMAFNAHRVHFIRQNRDSMRIPLVKPELWDKGDTLFQPELTQSLLRIAENGRAGFYEGETSGLIRAEMQAISQINRVGGLVDSVDLADYHSVWRKPLVTEYKNYRLIGMGPPSSGGIALAQLLGISERYNWNKKGWQSPENIHFMTEAARRVYADRSEYLGDPDFYSVPLADLSSPVYLKNRMAGFDPKNASKSEVIKPGILPNSRKESEETTHYSIIDAEGNAVSVTTTLNSSFGSCVFVQGAGFLLNNEMDDFSAAPGVPNLYGLIGSQANNIQPEKRMLSSMTPTIVEKNGHLSMVMGSPGGSTIITNIYQIFLNVTAYGMTMQEAVEAGKVHHQWLPDKLFHEKGAISDEAMKKLLEKGHLLEERPPIGSAQCIRVLADGRLEAGVDPRRDASAAGK